MSDRRTLIERIVVATLSLSIAVIFVVATKPWQARLPRDHTPTHGPTVSPTVSPTVGPTPSTGSR